MIAPASSKLSEIARPLLVLDLPFLFEDVDDVQEFTTRDSRSGQAIYESEELSSSNMQVMGLWGNGFYQFTSNTAIRTPDDLQGQRIRITPSDVIRSYIETWGAETTPMAFAEVFTGLQQGVVDGQYNPYSNIESQQFYTVQDYLTVSNHGYLIYPLVINKEFFESLPDDLQQVVTESADEASTYVGEIAEEDNQEARRVIEESGDIEFIELSEEERQAFKDEVVPSVWNEFSEDIGQDVIDELLAKQEQQASR
jgi:C4-dicarboxylate-binding protein DctP